MTSRSTRHGTGCELTTRAGRDIPSGVETVAGRVLCVQQAVAQDSASVLIGSQPVDRGVENKT